MNMENRLPDTSDIEAALGTDARSRRSRTIWRLVFVLGALAVLLGGLWIYLDQTGDGQSLRYTTQPAEIRDLQVTIAATGTTEPTQVVEVSSELSGIVRGVNVDNNSIVKRGDTLAELDSARRKAQRDRAQAAVNASAARVTEAEATATERGLVLQRLEQLRSRGVSPQQDLEAARAADARAKAAVASANADLAVAQADLLLEQTDLDKSAIRSPIDGVILSRSVEPGQTVASSFQAPVLFKIAGDLRAMRVEANIDEADIGGVNTGQKARFTVDAYPGRSFEATVEEIYFAPQTVEGVVTYQAILAVDNRELLLRPGMTATANVIINDIKQALVIPNAALRYAPPKAEEEDNISFIRRLMPRMPRMEQATENVPMTGERAVYVLRGGVSTPVNIKVGASDGSFSQVLEGELKAGDQLIVEAGAEGS
jgi:HlyD family secretion protein